MKYKIHYTVGAVEDAIIIEGQNTKEIIDSTMVEMARRNLDADEHQMWSEKIK